MFGLWKISPLFSAKNKKNQFRYKNYFKKNPKLMIPKIFPKNP